MATNKGNDSLLQSKTEATPFATLAKSFLGAYQEFSEKLLDSGILDRLNALTQQVSSDSSRYNCLITCGISGAGKSTLIARLFSRLSAAEFWMTIRNAPRDENGRIHIVEGNNQIVLGGGNNATTLIPTVYLVGNTFICDMPGFSDSSEEKDAIITVLRKCLLTKIKTGRLLIVCKAADAIADKMGSGVLVQQYVDPLKKLVGTDAFDACLKFSHFVVTKSELDREKTTPDKVSKNLKDAAFDLLSANPPGAIFLKRLETCKIFTDYEKESGEELFGRLNEMISKDAKANSVDDSMVDWRIEALAAGGDELNIRCHIELNRIEKTIEVVKTAFAKLNEDTSNEQKLVSEAAAVDIQQRMVLVKQVEYLKKTKEDLTKRSNSLPAEIAMDDALRTRLLGVIDVKKEQEKMVGEGLANHKVVTVRVDYSSPDSRATRFSARTYSVDLNMNVGGGDVAIIAISAQGGAEALAQRLGSSDWIPQSISDITELRADYVLYNDYSGNKIQKIEFTVAPDQSNPMIRKIQGKANEPFMVLVYRACRYLDTLEFKALERELNKVIKSHEYKIEELDGKIEQKTIDLKQVETDLNATNNALLRAESDKKDMDVKMHNHLAKLDASKDQMLESFNKLKAKREVVEMQTNLDLLRSIGSVFSQNNIAYSWGPQREQALKNLDVLLNTIPNLCKNVEEWASGRRSMLSKCIDGPSSIKNVTQNGEKRPVQALESQGEPKQDWNSQAPVAKKGGW